MLVAAIFFVGLRRLLALSATLALCYPIKKMGGASCDRGRDFLRHRDRLTPWHRTRFVHDRDHADVGYLRPAGAEEQGKDGRLMTKEELAPRASNNSRQSRR